MRPTMMTLSGTKQQVDWGIIFIKNFVSDPQTGQKLRTLKPILEIYQELGLKEEKAKELYYNLRLQHEMAGGKSDNIDQIKKYDRKMELTIMIPIKVLMKGFMVIR